MFEKYDTELLNSFRTPGYDQNRVPRDPRYQIPDVVLHTPTLRKIKVISLGAGVSGIANAYFIQKHLQNVDHVIYEKNADLGGTWLENRYPNQPEWPRFFSLAPDIWEYLRKVVDTFDLRKYMRFKTQAVGAYWQEDKSEWLVKLKRTNPDGTVEEFEDRGHVLLYGTGILNNPKWPTDIEDFDKFKGRVVHTARWPSNYTETEWQKDRVAVIGSGASSVQAVPGMQPRVKHMDVFVRTGVWFVPIADNYGQNHVYTEQQRRDLHHADNLVEHAKSIENQINGRWGTFYKSSPASYTAKQVISDRMASFIKDERLLKGITPEFGIGCRRITPGDPYMKAIQESNVAVHFTPVVRVTENGVVGEDGEERACDTIVCATGFDTSYRPRFPIIGRGGVNLQEKWAVCPEGYLGLAVPDMPNFVQFIGPTWPVENGSVMGPLMQVCVYAMHMIRKLQMEMVASLAPRQDVTDDFNAHVQEWVRHTVWTEGCRSWYRNNETGRVNAIWPGSSLHYIESIRTPRWEDYEITHWGPAKQNRWAHLGMGFVYNNVIMQDFSPYMSVEALDPEWIKAANIKLTPEQEKRKGMEEEEWASGAKLGALCLAGAASVIVYSLRTMPRWTK